MNNKITIEEARNLLGLGEKYTKSEINQSYKEMAKIYHSDNSVTGDEEKFKLINEAKSILMASLLDSNFKSYSSKDTSSSDNSFFDENSFVNTTGFYDSEPDFYERKTTKTSYYDYEEENLTGFEKDTYKVYEYEYNFFGNIPYSFKNTKSNTEMLFSAGYRNDNIECGISEIAFDNYMQNRYSDEIRTKVNKESALNPACAMVSNILRTFPHRYANELKEDIVKVNGQSRKGYKSKKRKQPKEKNLWVELFILIVSFLLSLAWTCFLGGFKFAYLTLSVFLIIFIVAEYVNIPIFVPIVMIILWFAFKKGKKKANR